MPIVAKNSPNFKLVSLKTLLIDLTEFSVSLENKVTKDSQIKEMLQLAEREGLEIVETKRESHSAKEAGQRPVFNEIIEEIKAGKFNGILTWAPG